MYLLMLSKQEQGYGLVLESFCKVVIRIKVFLFPSVFAMDSFVLRTRNW